MSALPASVTLDNVAQALAAARAQLAEHGELDLAPLAHFDSAAIAMLLELARERSPLALRNPPPNLRKLAALYGVEDLVLGDAR